MRPPQSEVSPYFPPAHGGFPLFFFNTMAAGSWERKTDDSFSPGPWRGAGAVALRARKPGDVLIEPTGEGEGQTGGGVGGRLGSGNWGRVKSAGLERALCWSSQFKLTEPKV